MIELEPARAAQVEAFLAELQRRGRRTNLVGSLERESLLEHVRDSLAAAAHLPEGARVVDLGSGAGFPGVPLAIARPDLEICLVELRERRVHFLRHVARAIGLACEVRRADLDAPPERRFDVALARAVSAPRALLPRARHWVSADGGQVWIWAGPSAELVPGSDLGSIPLERGEILRRRA